jgi:hypothetical protein
MRWFPSDESIHSQHLKTVLQMSAGKSDECNATYILLNAGRVLPTQECLSRWTSLIVRWHSESDRIPQLPAPSKHRYILHRTMSQQTLVEGKYTLKSLMDTAERVVKEKTMDTMVLDAEAENRIPKFRLSGEQLPGVLLERRVCGPQLTSFV